ncbi:hypothetical protein A3F37_01100 [Candidatus Saccharibacteria bacterium RIFCSPHIGHO2_12_FULL_41_12]|nr:MAG: hypothetical protein A3F37_01100 [Candidatus Saccharibacteria bacterium RIFCSPHIGHO2_12_FULL_41_12]
MVLSSDESIRLEPTMVMALRLIGATFGIILAGLLVFIAHHEINGNAAHPTVAYLSAFIFTVISILHVVWNPFSLRKIAFYYTGFGIGGALISAFVFGLNTATIYPAWASLFFAAYIFFNVRAAYLYIAFLCSGVLWLVLYYPRLSPEEIVQSLLSIVFEGFLFLVIIYAWRLAEDRLKRLEKSREVEQFEHRRLAGLVNSVLDSVVAVDQTGTIQLYNAATLGLFDTHQKLEGTSIDQLVNIVNEHGENVSIMELASKVNTKNVAYTNLSHHFSDGDVIALSIKIAQISPERSEKGLSGFSFIFSDITKAKSLENEKDEFISVVSHELRTPITIAEGAISNMMLIAQRNKADEMITKGLVSAHDQVIYLAGMINNISTLSEAESVIKLEYKPVDINQLTQDLYQTFSPLAQRVGLIFTLDVASDIGEIRTNHSYLDKILQNFITNAVKYTQQGSISLHVHRVKEGVYFAMSDTGPGINKTDQNKIFWKFYRSEDYHIRESGGTGLGLYVANKLCDKIGAKIHLESHLGQGSTFSFVVPEK